MSARCAVLALAEKRELVMPGISMLISQPANRRHISGDQIFIIEQKRGTSSSEVRGQ